MRGQCEGLTQPRAVAGDDGVANPGGELGVNAVYPVALCHLSVVMRQYPGTARLLPRPGWLGPGWRCRDLLQQKVDQRSDFCGQYI